MNYREKSVMFLATGCFVGNMPVAPGTFGSLMGLPLCFLLSGIDIAVAILLSAVFIFFSVWIAHAAEKITDTKDPGCIVIDEIAGILIVFLGLPFDAPTAAAGFMIFRLFDILKPFPIRFLENKLPGGAGIVMDDVMAGIYSNFVLRALLYVLQSLG